MKEMPISREAYESVAKKQPTGPIVKQLPSTPFFPPTKRFNGKPAVEKLGGIDVPDQYYFGNYGQQNVAQKVFDATLDRAKQTLTLTVKIKFEFVDLHHMDWKDDQPVWGKRLQTWEDKKERKEKFIRAFTNVIQSRWSGKHKLSPVTHCDEPVKIYDTVLHVEPVTTGEHKVVKVHFDNDHEISEHGFNDVIPRASANIHDIILSESDVKIAAETPGIVKGQPIVTKNYSVAAHEFGHAIGLHHINEKAANANQALDPYGETLEQRNDTMGNGGNIAPEDMWPYIVAMYYFTGCPWETT